MTSITWDRNGRAVRNRVRPGCEPLEGRQLLASDPGYLLSGFKWPDPSHISFSLPPDGVMWDQAPNNLNQVFDARFGGVWKWEIIRALQTWAAVANINIVPSGDSALGFDVPGKAQGDPRFGDIRIGGFDFHDPTTLAQTYYPPPDGVTGAGDSEINTSASWKVGSDYDLYSVMLHEMGLALGLAETRVVGPVMNGTYGGIRAGLTPQDIAGIQAIYGPRTADPFQAQGLGISAASTIDLTGNLDASGQETLGGLSLATIGDTEYFRVVAPASAAGLQVSAIGNGISLLSPAIHVYDAAGYSLASWGDPTAIGDNATATVGHVVPGHVYYVTVTGATHDDFAVGAYQLHLAFSQVAAAPTPVPASPPPPTPIPTPAPPPAIGPDAYEPNGTLGQATPLGTIAMGSIAHLTLTSAADVDYFQFRAARAGSYRVTAPGTTIQVLNFSGRVLGRADGTILLHANRAGARFFLKTSSTNGQPVTNYGLSIALQVSNAHTTARASLSQPHRQVIAAPHPAGPRRLLGRAERF